MKFDGFIDKFHFTSIEGTSESDAIQVVVENLKKILENPNLDEVRGALGIILWEVE